MMMMRMSITARCFKGDDMSIGAAFTIVEVYDKYKHVRIITHNTNILPKSDSEMACCVIMISAE